MGSFYVLLLDLIIAFLAATLRRYDMWGTEVAQMVKHLSAPPQLVHMHVHVRAHTLSLKINKLQKKVMIGIRRQLVFQPNISSKG